MALFKKKLDEQEAAIHFMSTVIEEAKGRWPNIYQVLKEAHGEKFKIDDEEMAKFDLVLAAIAQGLQAVKNLFPKDQAERIKRFVLQYGFTEKDLNAYALSEIKQYSEQFQEAVQTIDVGGHPEEAMPGRLLHRWLGKNIEKFLVEINGEKTDTISPILLMEVSVILSSFLKCFSWKQIKDNYKLVPGDLPLDTRCENVDSI